MMPAESSRREFLLLFVVLATGLLVRLTLIPLPIGQSIDLNIFIGWVDLLRERGLAMIYVDSGIDYPPVVIYLLAIIGLLESLLPDSLRAGDAALRALLRLAPALAECGTLGLIAYALRGRSPWRRIAACAAFALNPAILYMAAYWTQFDAVFTFLLLVSVLMLSSGHVVPAWLAFTLALATKPQAVALAPLVVVATVRRYGLRRTLLPAAASALAALALLWPWLAAGQLGSIARAVTAVEPRVDVSAYNRWYLVRGGDVHSVASALKLPVLPLSYGQMGSLLFAACAVLVCALLWRQRVRRLALAAALLTLGLFLFAPGVHERFLYPVLPFALLAAGGWDEAHADAPPAMRWQWLALALLSLTFWFNLASVASFAPALWTNVFALPPPYTALQSALKVLALLAAAVNLVVFSSWLLELAREPLPG